MEIHSVEKLHSISGNAFEHAANKFNEFRVPNRRKKEPFMIAKVEGYIRKKTLSMFGEKENIYFIFSYI